MFGGAMLGAAAFSADPADGFPPGTPTEPAAPTHRELPRTRRASGCHPLRE
ncbi:hypothetical protein JMF97_28330 [Micromonospora fiedleri]|uniref:Uncharacterized protein n=1 Tax=Micromonospora fiedleri TaxID=1157498 RepID=A0ABS1UW72_9ACTN|nr:MULTISPECIES: hypothetical protein [Micromonospora]MBL6280074.1 hypothetical protein [Micromonospora fiedleri]